VHVARIGEMIVEKLIQKCYGKPKGKKTT